MTRDDGKNEVADLTKVARTAGVTLDAPTMSGDLSTIELRNTTDRSTTYRLTASVDWVRVEPARGTLGSHATQVLRVIALDTAPEGDNRVAVTVATGSGATTTRELTFTVEHAPDLAASAVGCSVNVNVVEEGDLTSLVLHWLDATEHQIDITNGPEGYEAMLDPQGHPVTYWVTATDARGNQSRTTDQVIAADAC